MAKNVVVKASQPEEEDEDKDTLVPPDGGWGWMILVGVFGGCVCFGIGNGLSFLIVPTIGRYQTTAGAAGIIPTISLTVTSLTGPFISALVITFSHRTMTMLGGFLLFSACVICYLLDSLVAIQIIYGGLGGLGIGMIMFSCILIVNAYFDQRRAMAISVLQTALCLGKLLVPPLIQRILDTFGYRGALLIMGAIALNCCVAGALFQPVQWHMKRRYEEEEEEEKNKHSVSNSEKNEIPLLKIENGKVAIDETRREDTRLSNTFSSSCDLARKLSVVGGVPSLVIKLSELTKREAGPEETASRLAYFLRMSVPDFTVLKNPLFFICAWCTSLTILLNLCTFIYLPTLTLQRGLSQTETNTCLTVMAIFDLIGRTSPILILSLFKGKDKYLFVIAQCLSCIVLAGVSIFSETFWQFLIPVCVAGFLAGFEGPVAMTLLAVYMGPKYVGPAIGLQGFMQGVLSFIIISGLGVIKDVTGDATFSFALLVTFQSSIVFVACFEPRTSRRMKKQSSPPVV